MTSSPGLHVVTHRKWVADDFALAGVPDVRHSLGLDLPDLMLGDSVWAPMEWMHRAQVALPDASDGLMLDLSAPDGAFLTRVPADLLGREIVHIPADEIAVMDDEEKDRLGIFHNGPDVFAKPANCKIESVPAKWYDLEGLVLDLIAAKVPDEQPFLLTYDRLDLVEEHRLWVLDNIVVTSSPYLHHLDFIMENFEGHRGTNTWYPGMTSDRAADAVAFGSHVLDTLASTPRAFMTGQVPRAFTLDVGVTSAGDWVVIEANPAWSSALYGADPIAVADCVRASSRVVDMFAPSDPHRWLPDPWIVRRSESQRPLTRA